MNKEVKLWLQANRKFIFENKLKKKAEKAGKELMENGISCIIYDPGSSIVHCSVWIKRYKPEK